MHDRSKLDPVIGLVIVGGSLTGVAGLVAAAVSSFGGDRLATGMCLVGAALAFGLLANAVLRS